MYQVLKSKPNWTGSLRVIQVHHHDEDDDDDDEDCDNDDQASLQDIPVSFPTVVTLHITLYVPPFRNPENYVSLVTAQVLEWFGDVKHFNSAAATAVAPLAARALLLPFAAFKKSFLNVGTFCNDTLFF